MGVTGLVLALQAHKAKIKGVSKALYNCYGNLLWHKNDQNLLNNKWAFVWHYFHGYKWNSVVASIPRRFSIKNVRKLLWATLSLTLWEKYINNINNSPRLEMLERTVSKLDISNIIQNDSNCCDVCRTSIITNFSIHYLLLLIVQSLLP